MCFKKSFVMLIIFQLIVTLHGQQVSICKQINFDKNFENISKNNVFQNVLIDYTDKQKGNQGEKGKPGLDGSKGEKGETGSINQTEIETIVDSTLLNNMNSTMSIKTKLEGGLNYMINKKINAVGKVMKSIILVDQKTACGYVKLLRQKCVHNQHVVPEFFVEYCSVGMKYGDNRISNNDITASSTNSEVYQPYYGRLDFAGIENPHGPAAWAAGAALGEWLQVNLRKPTYVTGVVTQGRGDNFNGSQYVKSYKIAYGNTTSNMQEIINIDGNSTIFTGNNDINSYKINRFSQPITAQYFRLIVQSWELNASLRMDYISC